ncbi:MAG: hypothetical protein CFE31_17585 [Rhizobiales bacterium PAR1]|nr:MAG: hypothetical protein CFE31_17585 [Rhizobiales bacterium PAR1]
MRNARPSRILQLELINDEIQRQNVNQLDLANSIGKAVSSLNSFLTGKIKKESIFDEYVKDTQAFLFPDLRSADEFYDLIIKKIIGGIPGVRHCLSFGETQTLWYPAFSTWERDKEGRANEYQFELDLDVLHLDPELKEAAELTRSKIESGEYKIQNGELLHIKQAIWWPPTEPEERIELKAKLVPHEYALFYTLTTAEHGRALRKKRLQQWQKGQIIPELSPGLGINIGIQSSDGAFILGRRSGSHGPRRGQIDVGAVEGFDLDRDILDRGLPRRTGERFDIEKIAYRALSEEFGISEKAISSIKYLGFGYDLQYCQWNVIALASVELPAEKIVRKNKYAPHGQEFLELYPIYGGAAEVFRALSRELEQVWSCGLAVAYFSLLNMYGEDAVELAVEGLDLRRQEQIV